MLALGSKHEPFPTLRPDFHDERSPVTPGTANPVHT